MFGGNMMKKLQEMQQKVEETKARLDTILVDGEAGNVKVTLTGNRTVKAINVAGDLAQYDKEELEDLLILAFNKALESAEKVNESEMRAASAGLIPGM